MKKFIKEDKVVKGFPTGTIGILSFAFCALLFSITGLKFVFISEFELAFLSIITGILLLIFCRLELNVFLFREK